MSQAYLVVLELNRYHVDNEGDYDQLLDAQAMPHLKDMDGCTRIENYIFLMDWYKDLVMIKLDRQVMPEMRVEDTMYER